jgi:hypothetical protein
MAESTHPEVDDIYHASRIYADESTILILASTSATSTDIVPTTTQPITLAFTNLEPSIMKMDLLHRNHGRFSRIDDGQYRLRPIELDERSNFDFAAVIGQRISYIIRTL